MPKYLTFTILPIALITVIYLLFSKKVIDQKPTNIVSIVTQSAVPKTVDFLANFDINTKGTKRIFTDSRYHNKSEEVFIEADNSNSVRVKKIGVTWGNFFETLPMSLNKNCLITGTNQSFCTGEAGTLLFYINGSEDKDALEREIKEGDSLLVKYK